MLRAGTITEWDPSSQGGSRQQRRELDGWAARAFLTAEVSAPQPRAQWGEAVCNGVRGKR